MKKNGRLGTRFGLTVLLLVICSFQTLVRAESPVLTLAQAVALALQVDFQVKMDTNSLVKAQLAVKKAAQGTFPQATVAGQYQYQATDQSYPSSYQVVVQETIPTGHNLYGQKVDSSITTAMWDQVIAEATLQIARAEVIYSTYEDYLTILKYQQVLQLQTEAVKKYQDDNTLAVKQFGVGKITKPELLKTENALNQAQYELLKVRADLDLARRKLANQVGIKDFASYRLEEVTINPETVAEELAALQQKALQRRLELQKDGLNIKKALRTWGQAKNDELPGLEVSYNNQNTTQSFGMSYNFLSGDLSWLAAQKGDSYQSQSDVLSGSSSTSYYGAHKRYFTLKLSWSLDFGAAKNETRQTRYSLENARLDLEKARQDIRLEVEQALNDYQLAVKQYEVNQQALPYYEKDLEIKQLQLEMGMLKFTDLSEARQDALEARITAVKSSYDRVLTLQKLKKAVGDLYPFAKTANSSEE